MLQGCVVLTREVFRAAGNPFIKTVKLPVMIGPGVRIGNGLDTMQVAISFRWLAGFPFIKIVALPLRTVPDALVASPTLAAGKPAHVTAVVRLNTHTNRIFIIMFPTCVF